MRDGDRPALVRTEVDDRERTEAPPIHQRVADAVDAPRVVRFDHGRRGDTRHGEAFAPPRAHGQALEAVQALDALVVHRYALTHETLVPTRHAPAHRSAGAWAISISSGVTPAGWTDGRSGFDLRRSPSEDLCAARRTDGSVPSSSSGS